MSVIMKQSGEDLVFEALDRQFAGGRQEALRINGVSGEVSLNGVALVGTSIADDTVVVAGKDLTAAGGNSIFDWSLATGVFKTSQGDNYIGTVGGKVGFLGATPVGIASAYTQTYSTAARTMPAATSHTITDSSGGSASTSAIAAITALGNAGSADLVPTQNAIATLAAELALVKADLVAAKKVINALIDDLQALGLAG